MKQTTQNISSTSDTPDAQNSPGAQNKQPDQTTPNAANPQSAQASQRATGDFQNAQYQHMRIYPHFWQNYDYGCRGYGYYSQPNPYEYFYDTYDAGTPPTHSSATPRESGLSRGQTATIIAGTFLIALLALFILCTYTARSRPSDISFYVSSNRAEASSVAYNRDGGIFCFNLTSANLNRIQRQFAANPDLKEIRVGLDEKIPDILEGKIQAEYADYFSFTVTPRDIEMLLTELDKKHYEIGSATLIRGIPAEAFTDRESIADQEYRAAAFFDRSLVNEIFDHMTKYNDPDMRCLFAQRLDVDGEHIGYYDITYEELAKMYELFDSSSKAKYIAYLVDILPDNFEETPLENGTDNYSAP